MEIFIMLRRKLKGWAIHEKLCVLLLRVNKLQMAMAQTNLHSVHTGYITPLSTKLLTISCIWPWLKDTYTFVSFVLSSYRLIHPPSFEVSLFNISFLPLFSPILLHSFNGFLWKVNHHMISFPSNISIYLAIPS